ncbi:hypothetical protein FPQ18DRAFT_303497 [Pyronema domesticum]|nr:hypothetical protein FPQ18DRAFT_303497 [Pyronema domesticum]
MASSYGFYGFEAPKPVISVFFGDPQNYLFRLFVRVAPDNPALDQLNLLDAHHPVFSGPDDPDCDILSRAAPKQAPSGAVGMLDTDGLLQFPRRSPKVLWIDCQRVDIQSYFYHPVGPEWNGMVKYIVRALLGHRHPKGSAVLRLDPQFPRRSPNVYGHNGLTVGENGSLLDCCGLRHCCVPRPAFKMKIPERYSTTLGLEPLGLMSSMETRYTSVDLTNASAIMQASVYARPQKPVRVIRKGPSKGGLYPCSGFRYDGLYVVTEMKIVDSGQKSKRDFLTSFNWNGCSTNTPSRASIALPMKILLLPARGFFPGASVPGDVEDIATIWPHTCVFRAITINLDGSQAIFSEFHFVGLN